MRHSLFHMLKSLLHMLESLLHMLKTTTRCSHPKLTPITHMLESLLHMLVVPLGLLLQAPSWRSWVEPSLRRR